MELKGCLCALFVEQEVHKDGNFFVETGRDN
jgi:hypothetical protein